MLGVVVLSYLFLTKVNQAFVQNKELLTSGDEGK